MVSSFVFSKQRYIKSKIGIALIISVILSTASLIVVYNQGKLDAFITVILLALYFGVSLLILTSKARVKAKSRLSVNNGNIRYEDVKVNGYVSNFFIKKYRSDIFCVEKIEDVIIKSNCIVVIGNATRDYVSSSDGNTIHKKITCQKIVIPRYFEPDDKLIKTLKEYRRTSL